MIVRKHLRGGWLVLAAAAVLQIHATCDVAVPGTGTPGGGTTGGGSSGTTSSGAPASAADTFEPDNLRSQASTINENDPQSRTIFPPGDIDMVVFTLSATSPVTIEAASAGYVTVRLFDQNQNFLDFAKSQDGDGVARIIRSADRVLPAGTYYVQVAEFSNKLTLDYTLTIQFSAPDIRGEFMIAGAVRLSDGSPLAGVTLTTGVRTTTTDGSGSYALTELGNASFTVRPSRDGFLFSPESMAAAVNDANVANVDFAAFDASGFSLLHANTASDGIASFDVGGQTARVKALDVRTGNVLSGIPAILITDGTDGLFGLIDNTGRYLPRLVGGFSAPGGVVGRTIDQLTTVPLVGSLTLSGQQADAVTFDRVPESLWPYTVATLSATRTSTDRTRLDSAMLPSAFAAYTTAAQVVVERTASGGLVPLTVMAYNRSTSLGANAWNSFYESLGYGAGDVFDVRDPSSTLNPMLSSDTDVVFATPRATSTSTAANTGGIGGKIIDSTTAAALANVTVTVYPGGMTTQTDANGDYGFAGLGVFGTTSSPYWLSATLNGYDPDFRLVQVQPSTNATANIPLNPILGSDDAFRIVLEWGQNPSDLDSHLWTPSGAHIYYVTRGSLDSAPFVNLDVDDVTSYGPETVTIRTLAAGTYTYAIHHFAGSGTIGTSGARVKIYDQTGPIRLFTAPTNGSGRWWNVFKIDGSTREITTVNTMSSSPPIDF